MNVAANKIAVSLARSQAVDMFTRLLLKLAGPVPSLKKRAAVRCLLNTARYLLKTRYRHATAYTTEKDSSTVKDPTSHKHKPCYSITQCIRAAFANIFVANISAPPFGSDSQNFSVAKILQRTVRHL